MLKELILYGRVQGVFCRHYCSKNAGRLGISGSATNLPDGTVKIILNTDNVEKVNQFIRAIRENKFGYRFWGTITDVRISDYSGSIQGDYIF